MPRPDQTLIAIAALGGFASAGFGAVAGAGLRIPPVEAPQQPGLISAFYDDAGFASAPAYPSWAPPPLYPQDEPDPYAAFMAAWDEAMASHDAQRPAPAVYNAAADLPPPYEVRIETREADRAAKVAEAPEPRRRWEPEPLGPRDVVYVVEQEMAALPPRPRGDFY